MKICFLAMSPEWYEQLLRFHWELMIPLFMFLWRHDERASYKMRTIIVDKGISMFLWWNHVMWWRKEVKWCHFFPKKKKGEREKKKNKKGGNGDWSSVISLEVDSACRIWWFLQEHRKPGMHPQTNPSQDVDIFIRCVSRDVSMNISLSISIYIYS